MGQRISWPRVRYPSLRRRVVIRPTRGILTAQSWPRKRKGPRHPTLVWWSEWLRQADLLWNYLPDTFRRAALLAARGSPQMPRDLGIAAMRGRLWTITYTDGTRMYPMAAARDVSDSLDVLSQWPGSLLVRGADLWIPILAGLDDQVLTFDAATNLPVWRDPAPPGLLYQPPLVADFPLVIGTPLPTLAQAPTRPLVLGRAASAWANRIGAALRPITTPPRQYTYGLHVACDLLDQQQHGIVIRDTGTTRCVTFVYNYSGGGNPTIRIDYWISESTFGAIQVWIGLQNFGPLFLRVLDDGVNFTFSVSADDANYRYVAATLPRTAWLANPTHIGFCHTNMTAEASGSSVSLFHYHDEAP